MCLSCSRSSSLSRALLVSSFVSREESLSMARLLLHSLSEIVWSAKRLTSRKQRHKFAQVPSAGRRLLPCFSISAFFWLFLPSLEFVIPEGLKFCPSRVALSLVLLPHGAFSSAIQRVSCHRIAHDVFFVLSFFLPFSEFLSSPWEGAPWFL